jgi:outer membrane murein-binding lipoprotein Lpp
MRLSIFVQFGLAAVCVLLSGCFSTNKKNRIAAPLPPLSDLSVAYDVIQPATGSANRTTHNTTPSQKSCHFSSHHRKNTIGYQFDESSHLSFKASPSFDVFDPSYMEVKVGLRFTKSFGGKTQKRPDCTYGSGYYGLLPYVVNNDISLGGLTDKGTIKSYVEDRLDEREYRQKQKLIEAERGLPI